MEFDVQMENTEAYLLVRVSGAWTAQNVDHAINRVSDEARATGTRRLLVDARKLSAPRSEYDRFVAGVQIAERLREVRIAVVYQRDLINKLAENAAVNRGAQLLVVGDLDEARTWLMS